MITVRREWLAKDSKAFEALANAKAYRENFDPSSSWRIMNLADKMIPLPTQLSQLPLSDLIPGSITHLICKSQFFAKNWQYVRNHP